jgi:transcriptional regulator with XRE-family HTH domain
VQEDSSPEQVFAAKLKQIRESLGLTQAGVAMIVREQTGIDLDPTAITRIERGQRGIALGEACAIASALGFGVADMLKTNEHARVEKLELDIALLENELSSARSTVALATERESALRSRLDDARSTLAALREHAGDDAPPSRLRDHSPPAVYTAPVIAEYQLPPIAPRDEKGAGA